MSANHEAAEQQGSAIMEQQGGSSSANRCFLGSLTPFARGCLQAIRIPCLFELVLLLRRDSRSLIALLPALCLPAFPRARQARLVCVRLPSCSKFVGANGLFEFLNIVLVDLNIHWERRSKGWLESFTSRGWVMDLQHLYESWLRQTWARCER